jgi:rSAM/selenodomain-associated transferase 1
VRAADEVDVAVVVLAKAPVPGRVKTRLCPPASFVEAAAVAKAALADTLQAVLRAPVRRRVIALEGDEPSWIPNAFELISQRGGGLDERLANAFDDIGQPAFLIGMDTPQLSSSMIAMASATLGRSTDAVLGRAADGGWWGVGLWRPNPEVFLGVPMSTSTTWVAQASRLDALGLRWEPLPVLRDVDTFADAMAVAGTIPASGFAAAVEQVRIALAARSGSHARAGARRLVGSGAA